MSRLIVGPFNRVEGDLQVELETEGDVVSSARVTAPMYRGFENMLIGNDPLDALTIVPRICGICSVSQSVAAARALSSATSTTLPPNGQYVQNLMLACENLADHLTHFYISFMPDFTRDCYQGRPWFERAKKRFSAVANADAAASAGLSTRTSLAARARWFELMGTLAGKWPHTGAIRPGGSSRALERHETLRMLGKLREMRGFLEQTLFGSALEDFTGNNSAQSLTAWAARCADSDLALFLEIADDLHLHDLGRVDARFISYGAYPDIDGKHGFARGVFDLKTSKYSALSIAGISEDMHSSWLADDIPPRAVHPSEGFTVVQPDKASGYTWNKAVRYSGQIAQTGALARQLVDAHPLAVSLARMHSSSVSTRVIARLIEVARILPQMETWLKNIQPHESFCTPHEMPDQAQGAGLTEAARGALGHWLKVDRGRISLYQIVAPTSWNFSPRDANGQCGPLEAALVGTPLAAEGAQSAAVQHIVRSFDPCMVCTVH